MARADPHRRSVMGHAMTTAALSDRRARLKLAVWESTETETIERILRTRLRERREIRGARDRRQAQKNKEAAWLSPVELAGKGNPYALEVAVKTGQVRCRFQHVGRWWHWKNVPDSTWTAVHNGALLSRPP